MERDRIYSKVFKAVEWGDLERIQQLFAEYFTDEKFDFQRTFRDNEMHGLTVLAAAAKLGHKDIVDFFVKQGADSQSNDKVNLHPVFWAAKFGHLDIVNYFVDLGVDKEITDHSGKPLIYYATLFGHLDIVQYLHKSGADIEVQNDKQYDTPLLNAAARGGHKDIVAYLLQHDINIEKRAEYNENTALIEAATQGHFDVVKLLVAYGADVYAHNKFNESASEAAYLKGNVEIGKWLQEVQKNPEKFRVLPEKQIMDMSADELVDLPQSNPKLMKQIQQLDLFARIVQRLSYDKQVKFYKGTNSYMKPETRTQIQDLIRDNREKSL